VRLQPDLDLARRFLADSAVPGRVVLGAITGSHHYGFPSPDSDIDIKTIHLAPTASMLGLTAPKESHDRLEMFEDVECDLTSNEARQALSLMLSGNGNMLERLLCPYQLFASAQVSELQELAQGAVCKRFHGHYMGYLRGMIREHDKALAPTAKRVLYAYRVALTGVHLLRTGELQADLSVLAEPYGFAQALPLIDKKRRTAEKAVLTEAEDALHRESLPLLIEALDAAQAESPLPERAPNADACNAWLVEARRREWAR
jgi:uncharacterized protein